MRHWLMLPLLGLATTYGFAAGETLWIDVRTPAEYAAGHLDGAHNIPHDDIASRISQVAPDKRARIKLYCGIGVRAQMAKFSLEAQGYEHVSNEGGYDRLREHAAAAAPACGSGNC